MTRWMELRAKDLQQGELSAVMASSQDGSTARNHQEMTQSAINMKSNKPWGATGKRNGLAQGIGHGILAE